MVHLVRTKPEPHDVYVPLKNTFEEVLKHLNDKGEVHLTTEKGTSFAARKKVTTTRSRQHPDEDFISFSQYSKKDSKWKEYARCYKCCWGCYFNCHRTIIGTYCDALDDAV